MLRACSLLVLLASCGPRTEPGVTILTTTDVDPLVASSLEFIGDPLLRHSIVADPAKDPRGGFVIAVIPRTDCTQCYRLEGSGDHLTVVGGVPLGIQYGLAHALELFGYRFFHPWK